MMAMQGLAIDIHGYDAYDPGGQSSLTRIQIGFE